MRNKILIVGVKKEERAELEEILTPIVESGGELFFAEEREGALAILKKEQPQLVLLDAILAEEGGFKQKGSKILPIYSRSQAHELDEECIVKPFRADQLLQKCHSNLSPVSFPLFPPQ